MINSIKKLLNEAIGLNIQDIADNLVLDPNRPEYNILININIDELDELVGGSASHIGKDLIGLSRVYDKEGNVKSNKYERFEQFLQSNPKKVLAPYIVTIGTSYYAKDIIDMVMEGNHRYAFFREKKARTINLAVDKRDYMFLKDKLNYIKIKSGVVSEQGDSVLKKIGVKLGKEGIKLAGDLTTGLLRGAAPIPIVAGMSDIIGKTVSNELINRFDKLIDNNKYLKPKIKNNYYFYKGDYKEFQVGNYGYDMDLPEDELSLQEMTKIRQYLFPFFKKFGYKLKIIGKRTDDRVYLSLLFPRSSRYPKMDLNRNPIIYPLPFDIFSKILDEETAGVAVYDLLKLYEVEILGM